MQSSRNTHHGSRCVDQPPIRLEFRSAASILPLDIVYNASTTHTAGWHGLVPRLAEDSQLHTRKQPAKHAPMDQRAGTIKAWSDPLLQGQALERRLSQSPRLLHRRPRLEQSDSGLAGFRQGRVEERRHRRRGLVSPIRRTWTQLYAWVLLLCGYMGSGSYGFGRRASEPHSRRGHQWAIGQLGGEVDRSRPTAMTWHFESG